MIFSISPSARHGTGGEGVSELEPRWQSGSTGPEAPGHIRPKADGRTYAEPSLHMASVAASYLITVAKGAPVRVITSIPSLVPPTTLRP